MSNGTTFQSQFYTITGKCHKQSAILPVKARSHSTIFDIPMRPLREDQKHGHRSAAFHITIFMHG